MPRVQFDHEVTLNLHPSPVTIYKAAVLDADDTMAAHYCSLRVQTGVNTETGEPKFTAAARRVPSTTPLSNGIVPPAPEQVDAPAPDTV